jgi:hypothetical protein
MLKLIRLDEGKGFTSRRSQEVRYVRMQQRSSGSRGAVVL